MIPVANSLLTYAYACMNAAGSGAKRRDHKASMSKRPRVFIVVHLYYNYPADNNIIQQCSYAVQNDTYFQE